MKTVPFSAVAVVNLNCRMVCRLDGVAPGTVHQRELCPLFAVLTTMLNVVAMAQFFRRYTYNKLLCIDE